jgi:hypothetical protein
MAVQVERPWEFMVKGSDFGLGLWKLLTHYARPKAPIPIYSWLFSAHFSGLSTKLATQSHGLSTWKATV